MMRYFAVFIGSLVLFSCSKSTTGPNDQLTLATDKNSYSISQPIALSLYNGSKSATYFWNCNYRLGFYIEEEVNGIWSEESSVAVVCLDIYPSGISTIKSGETYRDTLTIRQAGTYRIKYPYNLQETNAPTDSLLSNQFTVQ